MACQALCKQGRDDIKYTVALYIRVEWEELETGHHG